MLHLGKHALLFLICDNITISEDKALGKNHNYDTHTKIYIHDMYTLPRNEYCCHILHLFQKCVW